MYLYSWCILCAISTKPLKWSGMNHLSYGSEVPVCI
jgi:hypothetical protein